MASPLLQLKDVSMAFGGLQVVSRLDLDVAEGEIVSVIGPNGAGKTTLFNLITGLMKPDEGQVLLEGDDVTGSMPWKLVKRGLGRSFQQTTLFRGLSAVTNVTLAESAAKGTTWKPYGGHPAEVRAHAGDLLGRVGLADFAHVAADELSHGDQRSLEMATALAVAARLLLLDEPTAGLSPAETVTAVALIKKLAQEEHLTVLFVEHDMDVVFGIADHVTVMHRGSVLADGPPEQIRANPDVQRAYLGEAEEGEPAA